MSETEQSLTVDYATQVYKGEVSPQLQRQGSGEDLTEKKPWHQMEVESAKAYVAFQIYLDMGTQRTIADVGRVIYGHRKEYYEVRKWAQNHKWVKRAEAWDYFVSSTHLTAMEDAVREAEQLAIRYMPVATHRLAEAAVGHLKLTRGEQNSLDSFLDRYGTPKQRSRQSVTVNNYNVNAPALPDKSTSNLLREAEEADFTEVSDQADQLIPEGLRK